MKKDGDLASANKWPMIERKKNLISMHWVAFFNNFVCNGPCLQISW